MGNLFDFSVVLSNIPKMLAYLPVTLEITVISAFFAILLGLLIAMIRIRQVPVLNGLSKIYVSFMRGTPIIVQLYLSYYGIPMFLKYINYYNGTDYNVNKIPSILFVIITFALNEAAFDSESLRAAILSVDRGQLEAAHSLGMTGGQVLRRVTIPEAAVVALPSLGNSLINMMKGTSLAFVCSVVEMTAEGQILAGNNFRYFESYISLAIIYWALTFILERMLAALEKHFSIPDTPDEKVAAKLSPKEVAA